MIPTKLFLLASALTITLAFTTHQPSIPLTRNDTVKPAYEYFYHVRIPINRFNPPLDTIQLVMNKMGESMSVDRANELRTILFTQINSLLGRPVLDSVKIGGGKP